MLARELQVRLQALGQPGAARGDAHQAGICIAQLLYAAQEFAVQRLCIQSQCGHGRFLRNCSKIMQADMASASLAPLAIASVVL